MHPPVTLEEGTNNEIFLKLQNTFRYEFKPNSFMELSSSADMSSQRLYLITIHRLPYSSPSKNVYIMLNFSFCASITLSRLITLGTMC